jgi:hypothetical protein
LLGSNESKEEAKHVTNSGGRYMNKGLLALISFTLGILLGLLLCGLREPDGPVPPTPEPQIGPPPDEAYVLALPKFNLYGGVHLDGGVSIELEVRDLEKSGHSNLNAKVTAWSMSGDTPQSARLPVPTGTPFLNETGLTLTSPTGWKSGIKTTKDPDGGAWYWIYIEVQLKNDVTGSYDPYAYWCKWQVPQTLDGLNEYP